MLLDADVREARTAVQVTSTRITCVPRTRSASRGCLRGACTVGTRPEAASC